VPKKKPTKVDVTAGAPGNYKLNQKTAIFNDRRTNRNRDRRSQKNNAIKESFGYEKRI
jgi:hypothetical protein